jgi:pyrroline-5-carboxylate reductase
MLREGGPIWLAGCGNMAGAMLRRWLDAGLDPDRVMVVRPSGAPVADGVAVCTAPPRGVAAPEMLLLGFKPQMLGEAGPGYVASVGEGTILVSILAGVDLATLRALFPKAGAIVRAMPNLPVAFGKGVVSVCTDRPAARAAADELLAPLGLVEWVEDEALFDAYTALAGCGTGFVLRFAQALAAGGEALGIDPATAERMAIATIDGAAAFAAEAGEGPAVLAGRVASRGGSTQAGYDVLDHDEALGRLIAETLLAAERRNAELGQAARKA